MVFEDHAKLEWRAPAIDGLVCRRWRQIVLDTSRAWAYLEICNGERPNISDLLLWLDRSRHAPLHIRVGVNFTFDSSTKDKTLYSILSDYHIRIASLRMRLGEFSFFERRDFPCMRLLEVHHWSWGDSYSLPVRWGAMPDLRSLRLGITSGLEMLLDGLPPLKTLFLYPHRCTSLFRNYSSLVALMLHTINLVDAISGSMDFSSLTHLALFDVQGLKPHINAPCLVTYHESGCTVTESFSTPIPSLIEYGVYDMDPSHSAATWWHHSFPNIQKLSITAHLHVLISHLHSLVLHPHSLPALQMINASPSLRWGAEFAKGGQETMESLIQERNKACLRDIVLRFELGRPAHVRVSSMDVRHYPIR